jgi:predicted amidohydrolase YtcJ
MELHSENKKNMMKLIFLLLSLFTTIVISAQKKKTDLIIFNATIYTVDSVFSKAQAMAIDKGRIIAIGSRNSILTNYTATRSVDAKNKFIYPGFIDAHAHFQGYGNTLLRVNLVGTTSWKDVVQRTVAFSKKNPSSGWVQGRGWDQNDWSVKEFPDRKELDKAFPDQPVLLTRIDGHAAIANAKALELAGIKAGQKLVGGDIEVKNGMLTGILIDNAVDLVTSIIPQQTEPQLQQALQAAEANCFEMGLTTIDDCGQSFQGVERIRTLQSAGKLKMRLYVMLSDEKNNYDYIERTGPIKTDRLNVRSFKVYGDGALGSRGACLLHPYHDKPGHFGFLLSSYSHFDSIAAWMYQRGLQLNTHAIGDSGARTILNIYAKYLKGKNDLRWRIEHAQVVHPNDFDLFGKYSVIPSVQPTHATSDMYWAGDRLGPERIKGAYAYQQLKTQNGWIPLGTDFPVEDISPFKTFYAAVFRRDAKGWPKNGFQVENALSRQDALRGMTIWAARSNFEEHEKGSLEVGKFADFIILDRDLLTIPEGQVLQAKVLITFLNGEEVYKRK